MTDPTQGDAVIEALEAYDAQSLAAGDTEDFSLCRAAEKAGCPDDMAPVEFALRRKVAQQAETIERLTADGWALNKRADDWCTEAQEQKARAEAAESKLREAAEVMRFYGSPAHYQGELEVPCDGGSRARAFLAESL